MDRLALVIVNIALAATATGIVWHLVGWEWALAVLCGMIYVRDSAER